MGGSVGKNKSKSKSKQSYDVWQGQEGALKNLYNQASKMFSGSNFDQFNDWAQQMNPYMMNIFTGGMGGYENMLGGGAVGDTTEIRQGLLDSLEQTKGGSNLGKMYESIVGGSGNTYIDPMVEAMKKSSMDNLNTMQSGTGLDAAAMGQSGSSRHAMQNAMQASQMNQDMLDRETAMRGGAYDKDLNMKLDIARQADQGVQNTQQRYVDLLNMSDRNVGAGMGAGGNMMNLGMGTMNPMMQAFGMPWQALGNMKNIIGGPVITGSGYSSGSGKGAGTGASIKG